MKKFFSLFISLLLLMAFIPFQSYAAGSASLSGPGTVRAGDTITLNFSAGGGIHGGNGSISYDSSQLTLQGYSGALGAPWAVEFSGNNFVFYDNSMESPINGTQTIFTATFQVSSSVKPGTTITVSANGVTLSDGASDAGIGSRTYSVTVAEPLSNNANLKSLSVSNATITPAFSAGTTSYSASVPFSTSSLNISATAEHAGAKVSISNNSLAPNATTNVIITVTAENGATKTYTIRTARAKDPNYVDSKINTLDSLTVEGFLLSPAFSSDRTDYAIYIPYEIESISVNAEKTDSKSSVELPKIQDIPLGESLWQIPVTAENGDTKTYTITVFRAEPFDDTIVIPEETTAPTTEATEPPTTAPATEATEPPTETAPPTQPDPEPETSSRPFWIWILTAFLGFAAGGLTVFLIYSLKKK